MPSPDRPDPLSVEFIAKFADPARKIFGPSVMVIVCSDKAVHLAVGFIS